MFAMQPDMTHPGSLALCSVFLSRTHYILPPDVMLKINPVLMQAVCGADEHLVTLIRLGEERVHLGGATLEITTKVDGTFMLTITCGEHKICSTIDSFLENSCGNYEELKLLRGMRPVRFMKQGTTVQGIQLHKFDDSSKKFDWTANEISINFDDLHDVWCLLYSWTNMVSRLVQTMCVSNCLCLSE